MSQQEQRFAFLATRNSLLATLEPPAEQHHNYGIKHRGEENAEYCNAQHAGKDGDAESKSHFVACAGGIQQRDDAQNKRQRCHDNRAQTQSARFKRRLNSRHAFELQVLRKLDNQNGVLARQANQNEEPDLGKYVHVQPLQVDAVEGAQQAHRNDENNRQRQNEGLVQSRQNEEDEQDGKREDVNRGVSRLLFQQRQFRPFKPNALRQVLFAQALHFRHCLAGTYARRRFAVNCGGGEHVVTRQGQRSGAVFNRANRAERDHLAVGVFDVNPVQVDVLSAEHCVRLRLDLEVSVQIRKVVDVLRPEENL